VYSGDGADSLSGRTVTVSSVTIALGALIPPGVVGSPTGIILTVPEDMSRYLAHPVSIRKVKSIKNKTAEIMGLFRVILITFL
jgi:hypothetical protein